MRVTKYNKYPLQLYKFYITSENNFCLCCVKDQALYGFA